MTISHIASCADRAPFLEVRIEPTLVAANFYSCAAIIWQQAAKVAVSAGLSFLARSCQPVGMRALKHIRNRRGRNEPALRGVAQFPAEVDESVEQARRDEEFVFRLHVPSTIGTEVPPSLDLDCGHAIADRVSHDDIGVWNAGRRKRSNHISPQQLAHDVVLARSAENRRVRNNRQSEALPPVVGGQSNEIWRGRKAA